MDLRHLLDQMMGAEDSTLRRGFQRLRWASSFPIRDFANKHKKNLLRTVRPYTMVSYKRLSNTYDLCQDILHRSLPGAFVECGVWKGGTAGVMAGVAALEKQPRTTWLFDSFQGLPEPTELDGKEAQQFALGQSKGDLKPIGKLIAHRSDAEQLLFKILRIDPSSVAIREGWFQDTLPGSRNEIGPIAVLRLDGDWFESTKVCLDSLYDQLIPGGYLILDDYGYWQGCRRAVESFFEGRGMSPKLHRVDYSGVYFRKPE